LLTIAALQLDNANLRHHLEESRATVSAHVRDVLPDTASDEVCVQVMLDYLDFVDAYCGLVGVCVQVMLDYLDFVDAYCGLIRPFESICSSTSSLLSV